MLVEQTLLNRSQQLPAPYKRLSERSSRFLHFQQRSTAQQLDRAFIFDVQAAYIERVLLKLEHRADFTGSGWTTNPTAHKYEEKNLVDRCGKIIYRLTERALKSDGFEESDKSLLEAVVQRETM